MSWLRNIELSAIAKRESILGRGSSSDVNLLHSGECSCHGKIHRSRRVLCQTGKLPQNLSRKMSISINASISASTYCMEDSITERMRHCKLQKLWHQQIFRILKKTFRTFFSIRTSILYILLQPHYNFVWLLSKRLIELQIRNDICSCHIVWIASERHYGEHAFFHAHLNGNQLALVII